jgi:hypothetical protein
MITSDLLIIVVWCEIVDSMSSARVSSRSRGSRGFVDRLQQNVRLVLSTVAPRINRGGDETQCGTRWRNTYGTKNVPRSPCKLPGTVAACLVR